MARIAPGMRELLFGADAGGSGRNSKAGESVGGRFAVIETKLRSGSQKTLAYKPRSIFRKRRGLCHVSPVRKGQNPVRTVKGNPIPCGSLFQHCRHPAVQRSVPFSSGELRDQRQIHLRTLPARVLPEAPFQRLSATAQT